MNPVKLLEIKSDDWMKGLSIQDGFPAGGIFQDATNFNPFDAMGYLQPSLTPVAVDAATITTGIKFMVSGGMFAGTNKGYVFALGDRSGTGAKCFYRINTADKTVVEYGAQIQQNDTTGASTALGLTIYNGRIVYLTDAGSIRSNTFTPAAASDTLLIADSGTLTTVPVAFCIGPDDLLYYTAHSAHAGDNNDCPAIGRVSLVTATDANNINNAFVLGKNMIPRDITSDGSYLVIIEDDNQDKLTNVTTRCRVVFWDCIKESSDYSFDIPDSYLISCRFINGRVEILGASGLWVCNVNSQPRLLFPLEAARLPVGPNYVTTRGNIMYWSSGTSGAQVYAHGSKIGPSVLFNPHQVSGSTDLNTALVSSGDELYAATDAPSLYVLNYGATRGSSTVQTAPITLSQPHTIAYVKISLKNPLSSGKSVSCSVFNADTDPIMDSQTKQFSVAGALRTLIFDPLKTTGSPNSFEDLYVSVSASDGAVISRIAVYGYPTDDHAQTK